MSVPSYESPDKADKLEQEARGDEARLRETVRCAGCGEAMETRDKVIEQCTPVDWDADGEPVYVHGGPYGRCSGLYWVEAGPSYKREAQDAITVAKRIRESLRKYDALVATEDPNTAMIRVREFVETHGSQPQSVKYPSESMLGYMLGEVQTIDRRLREITGEDK